MSTTETLSEATESLFRLHIELQGQKGYSRQLETMSKRSLVAYADSN
jgi:hypothetical protein